MHIRISQDYPRLVRVLLRAPTRIFEVLAFGVPFPVKHLSTGNDQVQVTHQF